MSSIPQPPDWPPPGPPEPPAGGELPPDFETHMPDDLDVKHCYRHPDRETGVSCSNCGRPICHECMVPAAVGFRCPDCVREQHVGGARARVVSRGQIRSRWGGGGGAMGGSATVTKVLIAINVLVFLVEIVVGYSTLFGGSRAGATLDMGGLAPVQVILQHEYWRMFTSMFLHNGLLHIGLNMWALWVIGNFLERAVGRTKYLIIYFVSGFAGSVLIVLLAPLAVTNVGASGAIFGLFGALGVHAFLNRGRDFQSRALLRNILFLLVINLAFSFSGGISWQAHIGGLVGGVATMFVIMLGGRKDARGPFGTADALGVLVIVLVLIALAWWRVTTFIA
jgi:membrane associated rhomboid family serine protease